MKKTFNVDEQLLREAREACGAKTDTDAIRMGLEALVRRAAGERMIALFGTEPNVRDVPRRRPEAPAGGETGKRSLRKRRVA